MPAKTVRDLQLQPLRPIVTTHSVMPDLRCPDSEIDLTPPLPAAAGTACRRRRLPLRWLLLAVFVFTSFGAGCWYGGRAPTSVRGDREKAMRLADQSVREAFAGRWRNAYLAAGMARHADPSLPGLELIIGQMLYNAGNPAGAAGLAHIAQQKGEKTSASALLLGLEAWWRRGGASINTLAWERAYWLASFWLEQASKDFPGDAAPRYFLAELERLTGKGRGHFMEQALHRFRPWESAWILESKIQLASAESNGVYNAGELRASTRLDDSPQAVAVRALQRGLSANSSSEEGLRRFHAAFTETHQRVLLSDPALSRADLPPKLSQGPLVR